MPSNKRKFTWLIIILLCGLAACAPTTAAPAPPTSTTDATTAPALNPVTATPERILTPDPDIATKTAPSAEQTESEAQNGSTASHPSDIVLTYERAGGLKGIGPGVIFWTLYADGTVMDSDGRSWQLPPAEITALVDSIMALGFADFEASYIPEDTCCDRATHTITIYQDGEVYQVSVLDAADAPDELYQALDLISEFLMALPT